MLVRAAKSAQEKTSADEVVAFVRDTSTCRQQSLQLRSGILPMDVGPVCGECDVCVPGQVRRPGCLRSDVRPWRVVWGGSLRQGRARNADMRFGLAMESSAGFVLAASAVLDAITHEI